MGNRTRSVPGRPFEKGNNANPKGRPAIPADVKAAAREYTAQALATLAAAMGPGNKPAVRIKAAGMLLDRGWGRPVQPVDADIAIRTFVDLSRLTPSQLDEYERATAELARLEGLGLPPPQAASAADLSGEDIPDGPDDDEPEHDADDDSTADG